MIIIVNKTVIILVQNGNFYKDKVRIYFNLKENVTHIVKIVVI